MDVTLQIPVYSQRTGLGRPWPDDYTLKAIVRDDGVVISGDAAGLTGLAVQLLSLAQTGVPSGYHHHLNDYCREADEGSVPLQLKRVG